MHGIEWRVISYILCLHMALLNITILGTVTPNAQENTLCMARKLSWIENSIRNKLLNAYGTYILY